MNILVTGGCGFIGSNFINRVLETTDNKIFNIDNLTYAGTLRNLNKVKYHPRYNFKKIDIKDLHGVWSIVKEFRPDCIIHFAAESHVDRSIEHPNEFIATNITGTYTLLEIAKEYMTINPNFKFLYVSTDEVYGSLSATETPFNEKTQYAPNSPYSATKAASDHLVRAWHKTYGLKTLTTHCSNNYGPQQIPEKLIPKTIIRAFDCKRIPVYGSGRHVRDWIFVDDHIDALLAVLDRGKIGSSYCIGANTEYTNIDLVIRICDLVDSFLEGKEDKKDPRRNLIEMVEDRAGHDQRYAIDSNKIKTELGWEPKVSFDVGIEETIIWYLSHRDWWC